MLVGGIAPLFMTGRGSGTDACIDRNDRHSMQSRPPCPARVERIPRLTPRYGGERRPRHKCGVNLCWSNEDRLFVAEVSALPGCIAHGDHQETALPTSRFRDARAAVRVRGQGGVVLVRMLAATACTHPPTEKGGGRRGARRGGGPVLFTDTGIGQQLPMADWDVARARGGSLACRALCTACGDRRFHGHLDSGRAAPGAVGRCEGDLACRVSRRGSSRVGPVDAWGPRR